MKDVPAGTAVSYGGRWIAARPSRIATVPLGYADGVPRTDAMRTAGAFALTSGRAPVAGTSAWTSPCSTSRIMRTCARATRRCCSATVRPPGTSPSARARTPGRSSPRRPARAARLRRGRTSGRGRDAVRGSAAAMSKVKTVFACQACGFESSKWLGRCPDCGEWNSFAEERQQQAPAPAARAGPTSCPLGTASQPQPYDDVDVTEAARMPSGIGEFDRVLGGGIVPGLDGADRRRARDRQEHAAAAGRAPARAHARRRALRLGRGVRAADQDARRAARHRGRRALPRWPRPRSSASSSRSRR